MRTPSFLLGVSLLLWGWQSELLYAAMIMAAVLEGSRWLKPRWEFSEADISRIVDLCTVLLAIVFVIAINREASRFLIRTIQWLPLALFPLIAVQQYSRTGKMYGRALLIFYRRKMKKSKKPLIFDISYPFFGLCIISAASVNSGREWFYGTVFALILWGLWPFRPKRYATHAWILLFVIIAAIGYAGQLGLFQLQTYITRAVYRYYFKNADNPFKSITAIGDVAALKPSGRILFRVKTGEGAPQPLLLRQACYTVFKESSWYATHSGFREIFSDADGLVWEISDPSDETRTIEIAIHLPKGRSLLKVPGGTFRLEDLNIFELEKNSLGALQTNNEEGHFANFKAVFDPDQAFNRPPGEGDLDIPASEAPAVQTLAAELGLQTTGAHEALAAVHTFFMKHFRYSLTPPARSKKSDLADFLLSSRAGHCEHFATATVLLLRAAGIPARYVTGFSAVEYSSLEERIIVRQRHAHAWAIAYIEGTWIDIDNTPPDWSAIESSQSSVLVRIADLISFLRFRFTIWRQRTSMEEITIYLVVPLAILLIIFIRRLIGKKPAKIVMDSTRQGRRSPMRPNATSEFYAVEYWLNQQGHVRAPGETLQQWLARLAAGPAHMPRLQDLQPMLMLHYRHRFGPEALSRKDHRRLIAGVRAFLEAQTSKHAGTSAGP